MLKSENILSDLSKTVSHVHLQHLVMILSWCLCELYQNPGFGRVHTKWKTELRIFVARRVYHLIYFTIKKEFSKVLKTLSYSTFQYFSYLWMNVRIPHKIVKNDDFPVHTWRNHLISDHHLSKSLNDYPDWNRYRLSFPTTCRTWFLDVIWCF